MTNIIIIYLAVTLILRVFFKPNKSIISCGLVGFSAVENLNDFQKYKITQNLKLLALYNQERGEHGCGLYMNGNIIRGYDDTVNKKNTKKISDLMADTDNLFPVFEGGSVIIHTRHATHGAHTKANTHPFVIPSVHGQEKDMIIAHNGTIQNIWTLCSDYGIKVSDYDVDSHALGALMDKESPKKILKEYKGYAALLWNYPSDINTLYFYHGATRKVANENTLWIERPLFMLKTNEGVYLSSLEESLLAIRDSKKQIPVSVDCNTIFKLHNGKLSKNVIEIERDDANLYIAPKQTATVYSNNNYKPQGNLLNSSSANSQNHDAPEKSLVESENLPLQSKESGRIFFWKGRYWLGSILLHGKYTINHKGFVVDNDTIVESYFWAGILLKGKEAYNNLTVTQNQGIGWILDKTQNFAHNISKYAAQPVVNMESEVSGLGNYWKNSWYKDGHRNSQNFSPRFSSRTYVFNNKGFLSNITTSEKEDKITFSNVINFPEHKNPFDKVYTTIMEATNDLTQSHLQALKDCCLEIINVDSPIEPSDEELDSYVMNVIRSAVSNKCSIKEALNEKEDLLDTYYQIIEEDKNRNF